MSLNVRSKWQEFLLKHVHSSLERFEECGSDKERLDLCCELIKCDKNFQAVLQQVNNEIKILQEKTSTTDISAEDMCAIENQRELPELAQKPHPKISNGSSVIQINSNETQGRYLQARENIKAGDVLILEQPYAAVLITENKLTHCSHCFKLCEKPVMCNVCETRYCSVSCLTNAKQQYHKMECCLQPLLQMLDIACHLALRILLVTGKEKLLAFIKDLQLDEKTVTGFSGEGTYTGDYTCVYNLVTNKEQQSPQALFSYAMATAVVVEVCYDYVYGDDSLTEDSLSKDIVGSLLLHHMQQMPCNMHAITALITINNAGCEVSSKEQRRIATGIYPTASLMNHACDPDVIVSFINQYLVIRATHNIQPGAEIAHCYGPSASRMSRKDRQSLLQKQYFFTCRCVACKHDERLDEEYLLEMEFICQKCSGVLKMSNEDRNIGKCLNKTCQHLHHFTNELNNVKEAQNMLQDAMICLENTDFNKAETILKKCLQTFQNILHKYDRNVAETHDALARVYAIIGDYRQASSHCEQSTESVRRRYGSDSIEYGHELHKLSQLLFNGGGDLMKARKIINKAIHLLTLHYGIHYDDVKELQQMKYTLDDFLKDGKD